MRGARVDATRRLCARGRAHPAASPLWPETGFATPPAFEAPCHGGGPGGRPLPAVASVGVVVLRDAGAAHDHRQVTAHAARPSGRPADHPVENAPGPEPPGGPFHARVLVLHRVAVRPGALRPGADRHRLLRVARAETARPGTADLVHRLSRRLLHLLDHPLPVVLPAMDGPRGPRRGPCR